MCIIITAKYKHTKNDFILGVRSNPLWRKTPKANEMAATFINTILKSWGKVG
jgi:hypothetical protein